MFQVIASSAARAEFPSGGGEMVTRVSTVAFEGVEARPIDVQVQIASGNVAFMIVGLVDKAVAESRERVRAALIASGLALPARRITVNLAPADMPKEGSHYDLPIALGVMAAIGAIPPDALQNYTVIGELALDGAVSAVAGVLPAAIAANARGQGLICPAACGPEAAWASADLDILAPRSLIQLANHFKGTQVLGRPQPAMRAAGAPLPDLRDIRGQESAKRALEVAAAGGHNLLMSGPPGAGKSMLAQRLPSILPRLSPRELLEVSMIHSVAGHLAGGALTDRRPFRAPHHSASMAALVGGGVHAKPGEISLAHQGVLFLDELPEFQPQALDSLRQPIETGEVAIARANHRVVYPARFQLIAAMNPCRCGHASEPGYACSRAPNIRCIAQYQGRLSGPLLDRFDLTIDVPAVSAADLLLPPAKEGSAEVAARVVAAREIQIERYRAMGLEGVGCNAAAPASVVEEIAEPDGAALGLLRDAAERMRLSARGYHRVLKLARTLSDLDGGGPVRRAHLAEALSYRGAQDRAAAA
jgi:magnesium chelatase family protein